MAETTIEYYRAADAPDAFLAGVQGALLHRMEALAASRPDECRPVDGYGGGAFRFPKAWVRFVMPRAARRGAVSPAFTRVLPGGVGEVCVSWGAEGMPRGMAEVYTSIAAVAARLARYGVVPMDRSAEEGWAVYQVPVAAVKVRPPRELTGARAAVLARALQTRLAVMG